MIVVEKNWEGEKVQRFKDKIVKELFNKIGTEVSSKYSNNRSGFIYDEIIKLSKVVDNYFYNLVAESSFDGILPTTLKQANRFYIFNVTIVQTGGVLLTFIALLGEKVEPSELQMMY